MDLLGNDRVRYVNQPIAVVIAETLEAATEGAHLLAPTYAPEPAQADFDAAERFTPKAVGVGQPPAEGHGDIDTALATAAAHIEATYDTPAQYHNAMETHAVVAAWDGNTLHLDIPTQGMAMTRMRLAGLLGIDPADIHIRTPFLGGGFGSKLIWAPQVLGILAAKLTGRPVKLVVPRTGGMFGPVGHRAPTRQTIRLATAPDGALLALDHHTLTASSSFDDFFEPSSRIAHSLYKTEALQTSHEAVRLDTGTPTFMRAPGEATGSAALESAVDEMAEAVGMDPLEFRLKNYAEVEPISGKPFSSKALRECYAQGAERFGWHRRPREPRQMRTDDGLLLGWGMGTATFPALMFQGNATATIRAEGPAVDKNRRPRHGPRRLDRPRPTRRQLPRPPHQLHRIPERHLRPPRRRHRRRLRPHRHRRLRHRPRRRRRHRQTRRPRHRRPALPAIRRRQRRRHRPRRPPTTAATTRPAAEPYAAILARAGLSELEGTGTASPDPAAQEHYAMYSHGAVFAEVAVDPDLGQIRCTRLVGAFAAGRIINPRLVQSQYYGGMIWGISFALHEAAVTDLRSGRIMNANFGDYHVPVNADVPSIEAILVEEHDPHVNPLGIKGVGEIAITGTAAAIANAIHHATGKRIRRFPITLADLL